LIEIGSLNKSTSSFIRRRGKYKAILKDFDNLWAKAKALWKQIYTWNNSMHHVNTIFLDLIFE
jgi:hypothetical protein